MGGFKALVAFCVTVALSGVALADALPKPPSLDDLEARGGFADERGFYLRADLGAGWQRVGTRPSSFYNGLADFHYGTRESDTVQLVGVGLGYRTHDWLRFDVTSEYRARTKLLTTAIYGCGGVTCSDALASQQRSLVTLLNSYFEVGSWFDTTPYLGLGMGVAHYRFGDVSVPANLPTHQAGTISATTQNRLAFAVMAGAAYDLSETVKLDIGYRYLHMGKIESATFDCTGGGICNGGTQTLRLSAHELRAGLRIQLQDAPRLMSFNR